MPSGPSCITLNVRGDIRHLCLVPDLRGKEFSLSPLGMMSAVGFLVDAFLVFEKNTTFPLFMSIFILHMC